METFIIICIWYALGLLGSHWVLSKAKYFSWERTPVFGLFMALFGPMNLIGAGIFMLSLAELKDE